MSLPACIPSDLFAQAVAQSQDGITIVDANQHLALVYVNQGFEKLTGYSAAEIIQLGYHALQGSDTDQPELETLRRAIAQAESCVVTLRNYRKDGSMFWNEVSLSPVRDAQGQLTHYIGIQKDVTARVLLERYLHQSNSDLRRLNQQVSAESHLDPLVGLSHFQHFNEMLATLLSGAQRTHSELAMLMIDINYFAEFNERYGVQAGDECLRMVGHCIAKAYARHSDCASRYAEEKFVVISLDANINEVNYHVKKLCAKVRALGIPNSDSPQGIITLSVGGIVRIPLRESTGDELFQQTEEVLALAKKYEHEQIRIIS
jgi:diguanylate cyclase (GGDEF)-like protein/PAS domain S-box-containing protein